MLTVNWGKLYNQFKDETLNSLEIEKEIETLMIDEDVTKKPGIYSYILTREEKYLNVRAFSEIQKTEAYERQNKICLKCKQHFELEEMDADHITPWSKGGKTIIENLQMLCRPCNQEKGAK